MIDGQIIESDMIVSIYHCSVGILKKYLLSPIKEGIIGFVLFLSLNFFIKFFGWITQISSSISFSPMDFGLALAGFLILFLIKLGVNLSRNEDEDGLASDIQNFEN